VAPNIPKNVVNSGKISVRQHPEVWVQGTHMIEIGTKILEVVWLLSRLIRPGGAQGLLAEVVILRQQLLVLKREKPKCPQDTIIGALHRSPLKWKLFMRFRRNSEISELQSRGLLSSFLEE
jgi:hypothetical protein